MAKSVNKHRGAVDLEIGGRVIHVVPEMRLLSELETSVCPLPKFLNKLSQGDYSIAEIAQFLHVVRKHADTGGERPKFDDSYNMVLEEGTPVFVQFAVLLVTRTLGGTKNAPEKADGAAAK